MILVKKETEGKSACEGIATLDRVGWVVEYDIVHFISIQFNVLQLKSIKFMLSGQERILLRES